MKKDSEKFEIFTRRAFVIGALQGTCLAVLGGRLTWLEIAQGQKYKTLAEDNRINLKMLMPSRGKIVDRFDVPLAVNGQNFRVLVIPEQAKDLEKVLSRLQKLIEISQVDISKALKTVKKQAAFVPLEVKDNLNWEEVSKIEASLPDLPGVSIDVGEIRTYPLGMATAHLVGYVGAVGESEAGDDPLLNLPGFRIGKTGIEKFYDEELRGTAGTAEVEVNVVGREVRELKRNPGTPGKKIVMSIDAGLQSYMQQRLLLEKSASAVVMDVKTGAIYALTSAPAFDPHLFTRGLSAETWEALLADPGLPMNNKAAGGLYPPGSTFKMVTALTALSEGVIDQNTTFYCPGHYDYGGSRFHCWKKGGHGRVDLLGALAQSCDTFFYNVATNIGIDTLAAYSRKLGLGEKTGLELPEERPGLIPTKAWKSANFSESWQPGETIVASIGQGYIQTTPLQLAIMVSRLVNGGKAVKPWLTADLGAKSGFGASWPDLELKKTHLDFIMQGMNRVTGHSQGTARAAQIPVEEFIMGGKTGTAQVKRISMEDRLANVQNKDLPWKYRHHALFVGYAPVSSPRYACAVVVEHGVSGAAAAAPVARDLLLMAQQRNLAATKMAGQEKGEGAILNKAPDKSGKKKKQE